jgi:hypothetical protein
MAMQSYRVIRSRRRYPLLPHKMLRPLVAFVRELGELSLGVGTELCDERWQKAGAALIRAAELLADAAR